MAHAESPVRSSPSSQSPNAPANHGVTWPTKPSSSQFRLQAQSPQGYAIEWLAQGESLLLPPPPSTEPAAPSSDPLSSDNLFNGVLIQGQGPLVSSASSHRLDKLNEARGPGWEFASFDITNGYADRVDRFVRSILFVEPDLFVLYDHIVAPAPVRFQMNLALPAEASVDPTWGDIRSESPLHSLRIHTPGLKGAPRPWKSADVSEAPRLNKVARFRLEPATPGARYDVITVFTYSPAQPKRDYAFKRLEGAAAVGVRIHRDGLPTLVAFKTNASSEPASLTGFAFSGPVGVDVFRPKPAGPKTPAR